MQEQLSNAVKFMCFYTASGVAKTGLTVTADVYTPAGTHIVSAAAATELADGFYYYTLAAGSTGTEGEYVCVFKTSDVTVDQKHLPSLWVIGRDGDETRALRTGTAQAGAASTITLDAGASATNDLYKGQWVLIVSGTGAGQVRLVTGYVGSTKVATVHNAWATNPDNTSVFTLVAAADINGVALVDTLTNDTAGTTAMLSRLTAARAAMLDALSLRTGTAQAGAASTITLDAGASATNDLYKGQWVAITAGTGAGQSRLITGYVGSTKVATVHRAWAVNPDATSVFYLLSASDIYGVVLADTATTLTNAPPDSAGVTILAGLLTAARAGYLDNLNIGQNVASHSDVTAIQNNTLTRVSIPAFFERPDAGSDGIVLDLYVYNEHGTMSDADSTPTLAVVNESGTDRSANLGAVSHPGTGHYRVTYTVHSTDPVEQLRFEWTVVLGGNTRLVGQSAFVVDTTAIDFTAADRNTLNAISALVDVAVSSRADGAHYTNARGDLLANLTNLDHASSDLDTEIDALIATLAALRADYTTARAAKLDNLDVAVSSNSPSSIATAVWAAASRTLSRSPRAEG